MNRGFPGDLVVKKLLAHAENAGSIQFSGKEAACPCISFPGVVNGNFQYSCLKNSMDRKAWQAAHTHST